MKSRFFIIIIIIGLLVGCLLSARDQLEILEEFIDRIWGSFSESVLSRNLPLTFQWSFRLLHLWVFSNHSFNQYTVLNFDCPQSASHKKCLTQPYQSFNLKIISLPKFAFFYSAEFIIVISGRFGLLGVYSAIQEADLNNIPLSSMSFFFFLI